MTTRLIATSLVCLSICWADSPPKSDLIFMGEHRVFPHIAVGGGWTTEISLVNMGNSPAEFPIRFFRTDGQPWPIQTTEGVIDGGIARVVVGSRTVLTVLHVGGAQVETGWALISPPEGAAIAGHAIFRDNGGPGRPIPFEAVVPLSSVIEGSDEYSPGELTILLPFDNLRGFNTCVALANPTDAFTSVAINGVDRVEFAQQSIQIQIGPLSQRSFCLRDTMTELEGHAGLLTLTRPDSTPGLSLLAFRFDPQGAFTTFFPMSPL